MDAPSLNSIDFQSLLPALVQTRTEVEKGEVIWKETCTYWCDEIMWTALWINFDRGVATAAFRTK